MKFFFPRRCYVQLRTPTSGTAAVLVRFVGSGVIATIFLRADAKEQARSATITSKREIRRGHGGNERRNGRDERA